MLAETAESLARTARELKGISPDEWLTFEEAAAYLTERGILFSRKELDEWLIGRQWSSPINGGLRCVPGTYEALPSAKV